MSDTYFAHAGPGFAYNEAPGERTGAGPALSIFSERAQVSGQLRDDAQGAGFQVVRQGSLASLLEDDAAVLGDIVVVDCPQVDGACLAALARLDLRVKQAGAQLVVSTSVAALDAVFGCLDQSNPQILVDPNRADRVIALGRALAAAEGRRVRELSDDDRLALLRLTEQVSRIARRLDRFDGASRDQASEEGRVDETEGGERGGGDAMFRFESPRAAFAPRTDEGSERLVRTARPALPDPRLVRRIIRQRQLRGRFFAGDLFADPAWDMLLDLTAARAEHIRVSVSSLCIASAVPPTTALRWIGQLIDAGLFERADDQTDRRRAFITLTDRAADAMARYFSELGTAAARLV